jgi:hypothetical protein
MLSDYFEYIKEIVLAKYGKISPIELEMKTILLSVYTEMPERIRFCYSASEFVSLCIQNQEKWLEESSEPIV